jgi:transposase-like protein
MDAAELLGINERTFRRWRQRFEDDGGKDGPDHGTGDRDLGKVEGDGAGVAHDAGADLDQLQLEGCQRPFGHFLGQLDAAQEGRQVVGK